MHKTFFATLLIVAGLVSLSACNNAETIISQFDSDRAFDILVKQVEFGPRVPGSESSKNCRNYFYEYFGELGIIADSQAFKFLDPYSKDSIPLVNVLAKIPGTNTKENGIVLLAHYDSRPRTDYPKDKKLAENPIAGANDGASGVAVLLELAKNLSEEPPPYNVELVLLDGEDWGKIGQNDYYLLGSKEFARRGIRGKYRFAIVIDMIGDSGQQIYRELFSESFHKDLNDMIWGTAAKLGITTFIDSTMHTVLDDHVSLATSGVPAVDLIDFDYPFWHTEFDTPDKCSPQSLANVGRILSHICYNPSIWPKKK